MPNSSKSAGAILTLLLRPEVNRWQEPETPVVLAVVRSMSSGEQQKISAGSPALLCNVAEVITDVLTELLTDVITATGC